MTATPLRTRADDRGAMIVELAIITPFLIVMLLLVTGLGRMAHSRGEVNGAARDAARAASLERVGSPSDAARRAADESLRNSGVSCSGGPSVSVSGSTAPGQEVRVTVRCNASLAGLGLAGFPGSRTFTATSVSVIDTYRSG